jgi:hypothetical protein
MRFARDVVYQLLGGARLAMVLNAALGSANMPR